VKLDVYSYRAVLGYVRVLLGYLPEGVKWNAQPSAPLKLPGPTTHSKFDRVFI